MSGLGLLAGYQLIFILLRLSLENCGADHSEVLSVINLSHSKFVCTRVSYWSCFAFNEMIEPDPLMECSLSGLK